MLPLLVPNAEVGSPIIWRLYEGFPEGRAEYPGVKMLWHHVSSPYQIHTVRKPVKTLEDLKGLRIIGWNAAGLEMPKKLGAIPVSIPWLETYTALERKVGDGVLCPIAPMKYARSKGLTFQCNEMDKNKEKRNMLTFRIFHE